jgi:hypothetical protein
MTRRRRLVHLEDLLGRRVEAADGQLVGRIEEVRAERRGDDYELTEYLLGTGALLERLSIVSRLLRRERRTYIARWDQMDITTPARPRLTCRIDELKVKG